MFEKIRSDVNAVLERDPAARSFWEVYFLYSGFKAIRYYRVAHWFFVRQHYFIARFLSQRARKITGIEIHPGAQIGNGVFIDHGMGVVIGETTCIGNHVKLYQGVTLGALSTRSGQQLAGVKRHPTIQDNVTIYSGATILGGETVIGKNVVIGGNTFITESVLEGTRVSAKQPELNFKK